MKYLINLVNTGLGLGYLPVAPGTVGTLLGIPLVWLFPKSILMALLLIGIGTWTAQQGEVIFGEKDSPKIVIDEIAGFYLAMYALPVTFPYLLGAFVLFRIFDIIKPGPIGTLQALPRGWGVMADDLVAGIAANLILQLVLLLS